MFLKNDLTAINTKIYYLGRQKYIIWCVFIPMDGYGTNLRLAAFQFAGLIDSLTYLKINIAKNITCIYFIKRIHGIFISTSKKIVLWITLLA